MPEPYDAIGVSRAPVEVGGKSDWMPDVPASANKRPPDAKGQAKILEAARKFFERAQTNESNMRKKGIEALKFKDGDQWPADIKAARAGDKRPMQTINKIPVFTSQVTNAQRENRPGIQISPVGDRADKMSARAMQGLIRSIEYHSHADIAIDTAFQSAVDIGFGYWRFLTEYEGPDTFDQVIRWKRIFNTMSVYGDPNSQEPDGSDWKRAMVTELMDREDFVEQYPDANPCSWPTGGVGENLRQWITEKKVRVAEFWRIENNTRRLVQLDTGATVYYDELPQRTIDMIKAGAVQIMNDRKVQCPQVKCYKVTAYEILESYDWPGRWIPIVPVYGDEINIAGEVKRKGLIEPMMDPQRMKNYWATKKTEAVALVPNAPYILEEGQVEGYEDQWKMANKKPMPYLVYRGVNLKGQTVPPPRREPLVGSPAGIIEAEQHSEQDMMGVTGIAFDPQMQVEQKLDESGRAKIERRRSSDMTTFHYQDNLARSLRHSGRILIDLGPKVYDRPGRLVTIIKDDGVEEVLKIDSSARAGYQPMKPQPGASPSSPRGVWNPNIGEFDVRATVGPSYATRRIEAKHEIMDFLKIYPNAAPRIADLLAKNSDWVGADEIAARLMPPELALAEVKNLPAEAQALVGNLLTQLRQFGQERAMLAKQLADESADRGIKREKNEQDFEAKLAKVAVEYEKLFAGKVEGAIQQLIEGIQALRAGLPGEPQAPAAPASATPAASASPTLTGGSSTGTGPAGAFPPS